MDGLHLTEFPDGPSQPTSQVCGAILFSLALSDQVFARLLPIPSQVSELLQHAISIPQHADTTRLSWPTSEPPGENLLSLSFNKTNLRPYSTLHQSTPHQAVQSGSWPVVRLAPAQTYYQFWNFSLFLLNCLQTASHRLQTLAKMTLRHSANYLQHKNTVWVLT